MIDLAVSVTNIPRKVGPKAWAECWRIMADRADIFGANEIGARQKQTMLDLAAARGLQQYGVRISPNPVFWNPAKFRFVSARKVTLHKAATGPKARKFPGFNSARSVVVVVLRPLGGGSDVAVLCWHLVPNGRKVNPVWRARVRAQSLRRIRRLVREHHAAGRLVVGLGDANIRKAFTVVKGWRWLRGQGVDKIGILPPAGTSVRAAKAWLLPAPTDHKFGVHASIVLD